MVTVLVRLDGEGGPRTVSGTSWVSLAQLLPESGRNAEDWRQVYAKTGDKRILDLRRFAETYPDHDLRLYVDEQGRPRVGLFRLVREDMPPHIQRKLREPKLELVDVVSVDVRTQELIDERSPEVELAVVVGDERYVVEGADLQQIERRHRSRREREAQPAASATPPPDGDAVRNRRGGSSRRRRGWHIGDVVGSVVSGADVAAIEVVADDGRLRLSLAGLRDDDELPLLRFNQRGELRFELWRDDRDEPVERLRGVKELVVTMKSSALRRRP